MGLVTGQALLLVHHALVVGCRVGVLRQIGSFREVGEERAGRLLRVRLALRLLVATHSRASLVDETLAVVVRLVEHHYVTMLARAHSHIAMRVPHALVKRVPTWAIPRSCGTTGRIRLVKVLVIGHIGPCLPRLGPWLLMSLKRIASCRCARLKPGEITMVLARRVVRGAVLWMVKHLHCLISVL